MELLRKWNHDFQNGINSILRNLTYIYQICICNYSYSLPFTYPTCGSSTAMLPPYFVNLFVQMFHHVSYLDFFSVIVADAKGSVKVPIENH